MSEILWADLFVTPIDRIRDKNWPTPVLVPGSSNKLSTRMVVSSKGKTRAYSFVPSEALLELVREKSHELDDELQISLFFNDTATTEIYTLWLRHNKIIAQKQLRVFSREELPARLAAEIANAAK